MRIEEFRMDRYKPKHRFDEQEFQNNEALRKQIERFAEAILPHKAKEVKRQWYRNWYGEYIYRISWRSGRARF